MLQIPFISIDPQLTCHKATESQEHSRATVTEYRVFFSAHVGDIPPDVDPYEIGLTMEVWSDWDGKAGPWFYVLNSGEECVTLSEREATTYMIGMALELGYSREDLGEIPPELMPERPAEDPPEVVDSARADADRRWREMQAGMAVVPTVSEPAPATEDPIRTALTDLVEWVIRPTEPTDARWIQGIVDRCLEAEKILKGEAR